MPEEPTEPVHLDGTDAGDSRSVTAAGLRGRPWVGIRFDCCDTYTRIYRNPQGTAYRGYCPKCLRSITLRIGAGGTASRFFVAE